MKTFPSKLNWRELANVLAEPRSSYPYRWEWRAITRKAEAEIGRAANIGVFWNKLTRVEQGVLLGAL